MEGYIKDTTGQDHSPEFINSCLNDELRRAVSRVIWADVEQPDENVVPILGPCRLESLDRLITDRNLVKNSRPGLYNLYDGKIDRDKTDAFDSVVVDAGNGDLEIEHVEDLLHGIRFRSNKNTMMFSSEIR